MSTVVYGGATAHSRLPSGRRTEALVGLRVLDDGKGAVTVVLDGDHLGQGLVELRLCLAGILPGGTHTLTIDLAGVDRLSSVCVATLLRVKRVCLAWHVRLVLHRPGAHSRDLLARTGLRDVLEATVVR